MFPRVKAKREPGVKQETGVKQEFDVKQEATRVKQEFQGNQHPMKQEVQEMFVKKMHEQIELHMITVKFTY